MTVAINKTPEFDRALNLIRDDAGRAKIVSRIERLMLGNPGDVRPVGSGVSELRVNHGPGYRVYFTRTGNTIILLLTCGSKATQQQDIKFAKMLKDQYT